MLYHSVPLCTTLYHVPSPCPASLSYMSRKTSPFCQLILALVLSRSQWPARATRHNLVNDRNDKTGLNMTNTGVTEQSLSSPHRGILNRDAIRRQPLATEMLWRKTLRALRELCEALGSSPPRSSNPPHRHPWPARQGDRCCGSSGCHVLRQDKLHRGQKVQRGLRGGCSVSVRCGSLNGPAPSRHGFCSNCRAADV